MHTDHTSDGVQQPQGPQPSVTVQPQTPQTFSEKLNYEQLAVWLTNHPQFVRVDYQQDINKLKGT